MTNVAEVLAPLVETVCGLTPCESVSAWALTPAGTHLKLASFRGAHPSVSECLLAESPLGRQAITGGSARVLIAPDATLADPLLAPLGGAAIIWRLQSDQGPQGVLVLHATTPPRLSSQEAKSLEAMCQIAGMALAAVREAADLATAEASRNQFIHVTTHELRSPLAVSQTLIRNVVKGYAGPLSDKQKDVFTRISNQLDRLEGLVNDLLDLAASRAVSAGTLEPVMLNASVGRAVLLYQPHAEEKAVSLLFLPSREELVVRATEDGLDRIFVNLVGNAVKYTPSGGRVTVSFGRRDDRAAVIVTDTGMGIPAEAMAHLFEEFYRAPNVRAANITGTGLGLVIVQELVEKFGGEIQVESKVGEGTTFTVLFSLCC